MPLETIEHRRLYRQVADKLRALMDQGDFPPGARLPPERELAEKLGISRPTVREALIALEVEGRVRIRVGSGIYVVDAPPKPPAPPPAPPPTRLPQAEGPFEVLQARQLIETTIAAQAALKASPQDIASLAQILRRMASPDQPNHNYIRLDREFHVGLAGILGIGLIARVVGELYDQRVNPFFTQLASHFENRDSWMLAIAEHERIVERIAARDANGAGEAMRHHLQASQDRFSQSFGDGSGAAHAAAGQKGDKGKPISA